MRKLFTLLAALVLLFGQTLAQDRTLSGKVTDDKGAGLAGVTVSVKGTTNRTATDAEGNFTVKAPASAKTLEFSYVGFALQEVVIGSNASFSIIMKAEDASLSEVVVTSFGIVKDKKTLGYDVTQLNNKQLTQAHTTNVTSALSGKIPGVRVQGSGGSFSGSSIIIRGYNTFTGNNQPLFVVDGLPIDNSGGGNALQNGAVTSNRAIDINQDDIESMSVLKGPSAAALYGSRAANGVILITTKKGRYNQKNSVQFSTTYQIEEVNRMPEYQNQYGQGIGGAFNGLSNSSWGPEIKGQMINQYNPVTNAFDRNAAFVAYPDNVKDIFQTGTNWQNNLSFSGGNDRNAFRLSYGYLRNEGVLDNNLLHRHNFTINTSSKVSNKLTVYVSGTYTNNFSKRSQQGNQLSNPLFRGWFMPRSYDINMPFENAIGDQRYPMGEDHPFWTMKHNRFNDEVNRLYGTISFNYKFNNWLQADYKLGTDVYSVFNHGYDQIGARGGANTTANGAGGIVERRNQFRSYNSNFYLTANKRFNDFNVTAIVGNEVTQQYNRNLTTIGRGLVIRDFENIANTSTIATPAVGSSKYRLVGAYGDFTVGYKSIATINATIRSDWASIFAAGSRQFWYPSVNAALNVTELFPEIKSNKIVNNIKLRGNISKVGKGTSEFAYGTESYFQGAAHADGFGPTINYPFNGLQGFTLGNGAGNAGLKPEFTTNMEIGTDMSFFDNRVGIDFTLYKQKSTDLIFFVPNSPAAGISSLLMNAGDMSTKGMELAINATPVRNRTIEWNINVNYSKFTSTVDKLATGVTNIFLAGFTTPNVRLVAGDEYGQIYGNAYQRDSKSGKIIVGANGLPLVTPGVQKIGNPNPDFLIGVTNTINIKGVVFSFLIDYKKGGDIYSRNVADLQRNGAVKETAEFARFDAGGVATKPYLFDAVYANGNPNTTAVTAEQYWGNSGVFAAAEGFIFDATWFRIREASLSYNLPSSLIKKTPFGNVEVSVFGRNLFLSAPNYPHLDPEQNVLGISNAQGLEFNALPQTRSMGVGLKLSF